MWENTDVCAEQYRCASALYLMSVLSQCHSIIIDQDISVPINGKEVSDGLSVIEKRCIFQLFSNVQLPGTKNI